MSDSPLTVWPWRRGDGDIAIGVACARGPADLEDAKKASHDFVVDQTGPRRSGPIHWMVFDRFEGVTKLREVDIEPEPAMLDFLASSPESLVVVAMAATDAPGGHR